MQGKTTCKELADMVVLSIITCGTDIVYEKTAFIQNKKAKENGSEKWDIDKEQLFLLHNFPTFVGAKGIFNKNFPGRKITFLNSTGSLGNYGLFQQPGEIIIAIASEVFAKLNGGSIDYKKIAEDGAKYSTQNMLKPSFDVGDTLVVCAHGGTEPYRLPFLQNTSLSLNAYEFIRNLTQFNIGEPIVSIENKSTNPDLSEFNRFILKKTSLSEKLKLKLDSDNLQEIEGDINILCVHLEI
jgi:hypothetical protein